MISDQLEKIRTAAKDAVGKRDVELAPDVVLDLIAEADKIGAVLWLIAQNGCDCDCEHHYSEHDAECERCLACSVEAACA